MKDEYIIINKKTLEKRIEELEKEIKFLTAKDVYGDIGKLSAYNEILTQSTPLVPEIEKAFDAGRSVDNIDSIDDMKPTYIQFEDYISNLKLDL